MTGRAQRFKRFVIDLPIVDIYPFKKPEYHGSMTRIKKALFSESFLARCTFINTTYIARSRNTIVQALTVLVLAGYLVRIAPPVHTWRLEKAHQDRYNRHLKYLEENPRYEQALVHAYNKLAPPK